MTSLDLDTELWKVRRIACKCCLQINLQHVPHRTWVHTLVSRFWTCILNCSTMVVIFHINTPTQRFTEATVRIMLHWNELVLTRAGRSGFVFFKPCCLNSRLETFGDFIPPKLILCHGEIKWHLSRRCWSSDNLGNSLSIHPSSLWVYWKIKMWKAG